MMIRPISEWTLYKWRFGLAYTLVVLLGVGLLTLVWDTVPPGMSASETQSIITSHALSLQELPTNIIDLPYHLLQKASVWWFGVSPMGVRLPSLIFGVLAAICLALLLRRWFRHNMAVLTAVLAINTAWFLSVARLGTPAVMIVFWTSLILLAATYISQQTPHWKWWKVAFAFAVALSLYTPFMVYLFAAAIIASTLQPHLRYLINEGSKYHITLGTFLFLLVLAPLAWGIYKEPSQIAALLAVPLQLPGPLDFGKNLLQAASNLANPYAPHIGENVLPLLSLPMVALLLAGAVRLLRHSYAVRSYVLLIWAALLVPIVGFNPTQLTVLLVPAVLVMAIGLDLLIRYWYRLFPRNPYARFFGILPLSALVVAVVSLNYNHYFYGMLYSPDATQAFNRDPFLAQSQVANTKGSADLNLVVAPKDAPIYQIVTEKRPHTKIVDPTMADTTTGDWLIAEDQLSSVGAKPTDQADKLLVTDTAQNALRFRLYDR